MAQHPSRQSSSYSPPSEPYISQECLLRLCTTYFNIQ
jgi:hypothetical protein